MIMETLMMIFRRFHVCHEYRGLGIGTLLLKQLLQAERLAGYSKISLSVQKSNYAVKMYEKVRFCC